MKGTIVITISTGDYDDKPLLTRQRTWRIEGEMSDTNNPSYELILALKELIADYNKGLLPNPKNKKGL